MKIAFWLYNYGNIKPDRMQEYYRLTELMLKSVKKVMPDAGLIQLSDPETPAFVDDVRRSTWEHYEAHRWGVYASMLGDYLFVDVDVIFNEDVSKVFEKHFDVAVALRGGPQDSKHKFNSGVTFSKNREYWMCCAELTRTKTVGDLLWAQEAYNCVIKEGLFSVLQLPHRYNFSPNKSTPVDICDRQAILHFKGPRKEIMLGRYGENGVKASA